MILLIALAHAGPTFGSVHLTHPDADGPVPIEASSSWEVGAPLYGGRLDVPTPEGADRVTVELRYVTSVAISQEGPTWTLSTLDPATTDWTTLSTDGSDFLVPERPDTKALPFPDVASDALTAAIAAAMGSSYAQHGEPSCASVRDYPCSVGVGRVELRLTAWSGETQLLQQQRTIRMPRGC